jgi:hypothetical protein
VAAQVARPAAVAVAAGAAHSAALTAGGAVLAWRSADAALAVQEVGGGLAGKRAVAVSAGARQGQDSGDAGVSSRGLGGGLAAAPRDCRPRLVCPGSADLARMRLHLNHDCTPVTSALRLQGERVEAGIVLVGQRPHALHSITGLAHV